MPNSLIGRLEAKAKTTIIYCDNPSTTVMADNRVYHNHSRHIETRYNFIRELVSKGSIQIAYCNINEQLADSLTKPLSLVKV